MRDCLGTNRLPPDRLQASKGCAILHRPTHDKHMASNRRSKDAATESTIESNPVTEAVTEAAPEAAKKKPAKTREVGTRLTGEALLTYTDTNAPKGSPAEELALGAGYYTKLTDTETGEETTKVQTAEYYKAVAEASRGIVIAPSKRTYAPRRNRAQLITVGGTGNCVVGIRYTGVAGFEPGSKVSVTIEEGRIILSASEATEGAEGAAEGTADADLDL